MIVVAVVARWCSLDWDVSAGLMWAAITGTLLYGWARAEMRVRTGCVRKG